MKNNIDVLIECIKHLDEPDIKWIINLALSIVSDN